MNSTAVSPILAKCFQMVVTEATTQRKFTPLGVVLVPWDLLEPRFYKFRPSEEIELQEKSLPDQYQALRKRFNKEQPSLPTYLLGKNQQGLLRFKGVKQSGPILQKLGGYTSCEVFINDANRLLEYQNRQQQSRQYDESIVCAENDSGDKNIFCFTIDNYRESKKLPFGEVRAIPDRAQSLTADFIDEVVDLFYDNIINESVLPTERLLSAWSEKVGIDIVKSALSHITT